ncbi:MAG: LPXTG cell wall anchor domain-containing protein, partial [Firmicutes bacterium]|nr:LPXTG cell wall anchor domain-containing protein [Bacillota bacterium]
PSKSPAPSVTPTPGITSSPAPSPTPTPGKTPGNTPKTGDNTPIGMLLILMFISLAGLIGIVRYKKKHQ